MSTIISVVGAMSAPLTAVFNAFLRLPSGAQHHSRLAALEQILVGGSDSSLPIPLRLAEINPLGHRVLVVGLDRPVVAQSGSSDGQHPDPFLAPPTTMPPLSFRPV